MRETNDGLSKTCVIERLPDYTSFIYDMLQSIKEREGVIGGNQQIYFRGQANSQWEIVPSVFRGSLLSNEADLISAAFARNPYEFYTLKDKFECLAKLQHYGLPTRLLDITTNPLVALYFACQKNEESAIDQETGEKTLRETDGAVFYKRAYGKSTQDQDIRTVSYMATNRFYGDMSLEKCLTELVDQGIYTTDEAKKCRENKYSSLIQALQSNYFVSSTLTNERLIRQSGSFILPGQFNIALDRLDIGNSSVQRAIGKLNSEFEETCIIIPYDKKECILEELDFYNINEAALFPELEHQMTYIKRTKSGASGLQIGQFSKIDNSEASEEDREIVVNDLPASELSSIFERVIAKYVLEEELRKRCVKLLLDRTSVDWYMKEQVLSVMRLNLTKMLINLVSLGKQSEEERSKALTQAKENAKAIMDDILKEIQQ